MRTTVGGESDTPALAESARGPPHGRAGRPPVIGGPSAALSQCTPSAYSVVVKEFELLLVDRVDGPDSPAISTFFTGPSCLSGAPDRRSTRSLASTSGAAPLMRLANEGDRVCSRHRLTVGRGQSHAAEPYRRDFKAAISKFAFLHCLVSFVLVTWLFNAPSRRALQATRGATASLLRRQRAWMR